MQKNTPIALVSEEQLIATLDKIVNGNAIVGIVMDTIPAMNKKGNPFYGRVVKHTIGTFLMGGDYESACNLHLKKEGKEQDFKSNGLRKGETFIVPHLIIYNANKDTNYIRLYKNDNLCKPQVEYFLDGRPMTQAEYESFKEWIKEKKAPSTQEKLDEKVYPFAPKLESIVELRFKQAIYKIKR